MAWLKANWGWVLVVASAFLLRAWFRRAIQRHRLARMRAQWSILTAEQKAEVLHIRERINEPSRFDRIGLVEGDATMDAAFENSIQNAIQSGEAMGLELLIFQLDQYAWLAQRPTPPDRHSEASATPERSARAGTP